MKHEWTNCGYCGGDLDTGWECNRCGADWMAYAYPWWRRILDKLRRLAHTIGG